MIDEVTTKCFRHEKLEAQLMELTALRKYPRILSLAATLMSSIARRFFISRWLRNALHRLRLKQQLIKSKT